MTSINEIADQSLDYFATTPILPPADIEDKSRLDPTIQSYILNKSPHAMNSPFPLNELERALKKTKNKVTGPDLIHNEMLANFSPKNKSNVLRLFNILSISTFVPDAGNQLQSSLYLSQGNRPTKPASTALLALNRVQGMHLKEQSPIASTSTSSITTNSAQNKLASETTAALPTTS